jgi:hypothetical protein
MSDEELIGYCQLHCETERALFSGAQINRMILLAGCPSDFVTSVSEGWHSLHEEMAELCELAIEEQAK